MIPTGARTLRDPLQCQLEHHRTTYYRYSCFISTTNLEDECIEPDAAVRQQQQEVLAAGHFWSPMQQPNFKVTDTCGLAERRWWQWYQPA